MTCVIQIFCGKKWFSRIDLNANKSVGYCDFFEEKNIAGLPTAFNFTCGEINLKSVPLSAHVVYFKLKSENSF